MPRRRSLADMTDEQFERWLKRNGLTGIGAFNVSMQRRAAIAARKPIEDNDDETARSVEEHERSAAYWGTEHSEEE